MERLGFKISRISPKIILTLFKRKSTITEISSGDKAQLMTKLTASEYISGLMVYHTLVNGKIIQKKAMEY